MAIGEKRPQHIIGLSSEYSIDKWEYIVEEQGGGQWMGNY